MVSNRLTSSDFWIRVVQYSRSKSKISRFVPWIVANTCLRCSVLFDRIFNQIGLFLPLQFNLLPMAEKVYDLVQYSLVYIFNMTEMNQLKLLSQQSSVSCVH